MGKFKEFYLLENSLEKKLKAKLKKDFQKFDNILLKDPKKFVGKNPELFSKAKLLRQRIEQESKPYWNDIYQYYNSELYRKTHKEIEQIKKEFEDLQKYVKVEKYGNEWAILRGYLSSGNPYYLSSGSGTFSGMATFKSEKEAKDYAIKSGFKLI